jgi:hypothetical protein
MVLPAGRLPDLLKDDELLLENAFTVPEAAPAEVPAAMKGTTGGASAKADSLNSLDPQDAPARFGPTTPKQPPGLSLALCRLDWLACCHNLLAAERLSLSARERVPHGYPPVKRRVGRKRSTTVFPACTPLGSRAIA